MRKKQHMKTDKRLLYFFLLLKIPYTLCKMRSLGVMRAANSGLSCHGGKIQNNPTWQLSSACAAVLCRLQANEDPSSFQNSCKGPSKV